MVGANNTGELQLGSIDGGNAHNSAGGGSNREGAPDDLFGKGPPSAGDQSLNMSNKIDERTSLLPDGTRAEKSSKPEEGAEISPESSNLASSEGLED